VVEHSQIVCTSKLDRYTIIAPVTGYVEGGIVDWPSYLVDAILAVIEANEKRLKAKLEITYSTCDYYPAIDGLPEKFELRVELQVHTLTTQVLH